MSKFYLKKLLLAIAIFLLVLNFAVWQAIVSRGSHGWGGSQKDAEAGTSGELTVAFLDVGQGDAIFIEAPNGNQVVVDGGPNNKVLSEIGALMPWYDKTIDMIVITNPDKDHIAGFVDVLKRYQVDYLLESGTENESLVNAEVHDLARDRGVESVLARRGMEIVLDAKADVRMSVLFPDRDVSAEKSNDGSIIMRLTYGETELMLTGDAPMTTERHLLSLASTEKTEALSTTSKQSLSLSSDILKVGHHGSKTSTSREFVKAVAPQFAVISSGQENKYGHPTNEVLGTLASFPIEILRTDQFGTIVFVSDGNTFVRKK